MVIENPLTDLINETVGNHLRLETSLTANPLLNVQDSAFTTVQSIKRICEFVDKGEKQEALRALPKNWKERAKRAVKAKSPLTCAEIDTPISIKFETDASARAATGALATDDVIGAYGDLLNEIIRNTSLLDDLRSTENRQIWSLFRVMLEASGLHASSILSLQRRFDALYEVNKNKIFGIDPDLHQYHKDLKNAKKSTPEVLNSLAQPFFETMTRLFQNDQITLRDLQDLIPDFHKIESQDPRLILARLLAGKFEALFKIPSDFTQQNFKAAEALHPGYQNKLFKAVPHEVKTAHKVKKDAKKVQNSRFGLMERTARQLAAALISQSTKMIEAEIAAGKPKLLTIGKNIVKPKATNVTDGIEPQDLPTEKRRVVTAKAVSIVRGKVRKAICQTPPSDQQRLEDLFQTVDISHEIEEILSDNPRELRGQTIGEYLGEKLNINLANLEDDPEAQALLTYLKIKAGSIPHLAAITPDARTINTDLINKNREITKLTTISGLLFEDDTGFGGFNLHNAIPTLRAATSQTDAFKTLMKITVIANFLKSSKYFRDNATDTLKNNLTELKDIIQEIRNSGDPDEDRFREVLNNLQTFIDNRKTQLDSETQEKLQVLGDEKSGLEGQLESAKKKLTPAQALAKIILREMTGGGGSPTSSQLNNALNITIALVRHLRIKQLEGGVNSGMLGIIKRTRGDGLKILGQNFWQKNIKGDPSAVKAPQEALDDLRKDYGITGQVNLCASSQELVSLFTSGKIKIAELEFIKAILREIVSNKTGRGLDDFIFLPLIEQLEIALDEIYLKKAKRTEYGIHAILSKITRLKVETVDHIDDITLSPEATGDSDKKHGKESYLTELLKEVGKSVLSGVIAGVIMRGRKRK